MRAVHGVPADRLHEGVARKRVLVLADIGKAEGGVETVEGQRRRHEAARVALDAAVRKPLELVGKAKVLHPRRW